MGQDSHSLRAPAAGLAVGARCVRPGRYPSAMPPLIIRMDDRWQAYAERVARQRQDTAPARQAHGCAGGLAAHLAGAAGEVAFGLWCYGGEQFALTVGTCRSMPDFPGTEVRTRTAGHWDLMVRRDDDPAAAYVLVVPYGSSGRAWRLPGWWAPTRGGTSGWPRTAAGSWRGSCRRPR